jgi:hypothetical protein
LPQQACQSGVVGSKKAVFDQLLQYVFAVRHRNFAQRYTKIGVYANLSAIFVSKSSGLIQDYACLSFLGTIHWHFHNF